MCVCVGGGGRKVGGGVGELQGEGVWGGAGADMNTRNGNHGMGMEGVWGVQGAFPWVSMQMIICYCHDHLLLSAQHRCGGSCHDHLLLPR